MTNNTYLHNQTTVTSTSLNFSNEASLQGQQTEDLNAYKIESLDQYQTTQQNGSSVLQMLSQRGYTKGYKGL